MISCVMSIYGFYSTNLVLRRQETSATNHANIVFQNSREKTHSRDLKTAKRAFSLLFFTLKS